MTRITGATTEYMWATPEDWERLRQMLAEERRRSADDLVRALQAKQGRKMVAMETRRLWLAMP